MAKKKKHVAKKKTHVAKKSTSIKRKKSRGKSPSKRHAQNRSTRTAGKKAKSRTPRGVSGARPKAVVVKVPKLPPFPERTSRKYVHPTSSDFTFDTGEDEKPDFDFEELDEELDNEEDVDDLDDEVSFDDDVEEAEEEFDDLTDEDFEQAMRELEASDVSDIPLILDQSELEIDFGEFGEIDPEDISEASWAELLGDDFGFDDMAEFYDEGDVYEFECGIEYGETA